MNCWGSTRRALLAALAFSLSAWAQGNLITADPPQKLVLAAGGAGVSRVTFRLAPGHHTNSNTPSDEFLIPLRLTWDAAPVEVVRVEYPKPHLEKYKFAEKPLSVYTGEFTIVTRFKAPAGAAKGLKNIAGKLRFQACTDTVCFPPKTIQVQLPLEIQ